MEKDEETQRIRRLFFADLSIVEELFTVNYEILIMDCIYKTNRYKMLLLAIVEHTSLDTTFYVAFAFLFDKTEEDFRWVIKQLKKLYRKLRLSSLNVVVTNRDVGLINALEAMYSGVSVLLCIWYIEIDLKAYSSKLLFKKEQVDKF